MRGLERVCKLHICSFCEFRGPRYEARQAHTVRKSARMCTTTQKFVTICLERKPNPYMFPIVLFHLHYSQSVQSGHKLSNEAQPKPHSSYTHTQELRKFGKKVVERKGLRMQVCSCFCEFANPCLKHVH